MVATRGDIQFIAKICAWLLGKDGESGWPCGNSDLLSVAGARKNGALYETGGVRLRSF